MPLVLIFDPFYTGEAIILMSKKNRKPKLPVFHKEMEFINTFYQSLKPFYC
jgi:hypothetical protein